MNFDLHCHSTASDGLLSPAELVARAKDKGVEVLALTDHDVVSGLAQARDAARARGIGFIDGVEISVTWENTTLHVVGLQIDPGNAELNEGLDVVRGSRAARAGKIAASLEQAGIADSLAGATAHAGNPDLISRTHFARFLVDKGYAKDVSSVFHRFLAQGKPGYVPHQWAELGDAVTWIRASGGIAVLAHPGRYKLSRTERRALLAGFKDCGGLGVEVITGSHTPGNMRIRPSCTGIRAARLARVGFSRAPGEPDVESARCRNCPTI